MIFRSLLSIPRATVVNLSRNRGDDMVEVVVRAGSKPGAMVTARVEAFKTIPFREQEVKYVEQLDKDRFFNKWRVEIVDQESMSSIGE